MVTVQCGYKYSRDRRLTKTFLFFKYRIEIDFYMDMHNSSENIIFMAMMDSQCILKTACKLNKKQWRPPTQIFRQIFYLWKTNYTTDGVLVNQCWMMSSITILTALLYHLKTSLDRSLQTKYFLLLQCIDIQIISETQSIHKIS